MQSWTSFEMQIATAMRQITRALDLQSRVLVEKHGLTAPQVATLETLKQWDGMCSGALAKAVHLSAPTMTGILDRLVKRGLIERSRDDRDRRTVRLYLTDAGREVLQSAPSVLPPGLLEGLTKLEEWERTSLLAVLQRVARMMGAPEGVGPVLPNEASVADAGYSLSPNKAQASDAEVGVDTLEVS